MNSKHPQLKELKPRITVIGVGGAGGNAINNMIASGIDGVEFIAANTDAQALISSSAERRIQLGADLTEGLGAGARPEVGQAAAREALAEIRAAVEGSHMVFIAAGMGGGTGTGAASVIAQVSQELGILTVAIVTKPFNFEGNKRMRTAEAGVEELRQHVDTLIVIPNQNLFRIANERTTFAEAFLLADQVLHSGIACITDLIVREGLINLDFADVRAVMAGMGTAMMGTGEAAGERRAADAAEIAILNPLLDDVSLRGAKGLLISISGSRSLTLYEVDQAASRVREEVDPEANVIIGATFDETLGDKIRVSIVASGLYGAALASAGRPAKQASAAAAAIPMPQLAAAPQRREEAPSRGGRWEGPGPIAQDERRWTAENARDAGRDDQQREHPAEWNAPNDVVIELTDGRPPQNFAPEWENPAPDYATEPAPQFHPQPPAAGRRLQRRMPEVGDFTPFAQEAYRSKRPEAQPGVAPEPASPERKRSGFFTFLTGRRDTAPATGESVQGARKVIRQGPVEGMSAVRPNDGDRSGNSDSLPDTPPRRIPMPRHRPR